MAELYVEGVDELVTGEAVTLDLPPASLGLHVASAAIDVLASVAVLIAGFWATALLAADAATSAVGSILTLVSAMIVLPATVETLSRGRSLGKLATGLRTVRDDAGPISFHHAFTRALIGIATCPETSAQRARESRAPRTSRASAEANAPHRPGQAS